VPGSLVLVHTVPPLVGVFTRLCSELLPGVRLLHVLDEAMLERIKQRGFTAPEDDEHLAGHVALAQAIGAGAVLVTCSTVSLCVDAVRERFSVPVLKIDEAMAREAVRSGRRITVVATAITTLEPSRALLEAEAGRAGRPVDITLRFIDDALPALLAGDGATHDRLVERAVREEAERADVVVLAQATMARVLKVLADRPVSVPVLSSPPLALAEAARILLTANPSPHQEIGACAADRTRGTAELDEVRP
jgi:Asp/Glu/hydantoin racemase